MKLCPIIMYSLVTIATSNLAAAGWHTTWDTAGKTWYEKWTRSLEIAKQLPHEEKIELLGKAVSIERKNGQQNDEKSEIVERSRAALLSIPGHSEYYRDKINTARELMEANIGNTVSELYIKYRGDLDHAVTDGFQTMQQLPSVETVRVLGEFLFDERGYVRNPTRTGEAAMYDKIKHSPVLLKAGEALDHLPIVGKPPKPNRFFNTPDELTGWREWYLQIKEGKRTFRFEGDPTEYDLNGPAPKQKLARIALDQKRDLERTQRHTTNRQKPNSLQESATTIVSKPGNLAIILASLLVLVSAAWCLFRKLGHLVK